MDKNKLNEILKKHKIWLLGSPLGECANLQEANLQGTDLRGADLQGAFLWGSSVEFPVCPQEGAFIGWKKCKNDKLVKLLIPEDAKRSSATTRKCRCSKAKVLKIIDAKGNEIKSAESTYCKDFFYHVGETVEVPDFDTNRWNECSTGIHFFITREEAERY